MPVKWTKTTKPKAGAKSLEPGAKSSKAAEAKSSKLKAKSSKEAK